MTACRKSACGRARMARPYRGICRLYGAPGRRASVETLRRACQRTWTTEGSTMTALTVVARWSTWEPQLRSLLRIVAAFTFMQFGTAKLFAFPGAIMPGGGTAPVVSLIGLAAILETFGGLLRSEER